MLCAAPAAIRAEPAARQSSPERRTVVERDWGAWLGPFRRKLTQSLMQDFGEQYLYGAENARLGPPAPGQARVVFLGDSITDLWDLARYFPGKPYVNRGVGSQVTPQLVLRFHQDVVALQPRAVVILAGVNDVQGFMQVETREEIERNFEALAEMARAHDIAVVFESILPVNDYTAAARTVVKERPPAELAAINVWLKRYASTHGCEYVDYVPALADARGLMRAEFTLDGVHPTPAAYAVMAPLAQQAIDRALARPRLEAFR